MSLPKLPPDLLAEIDHIAAQAARVRAKRRVISPSERIALEMAHAAVATARQHDPESSYLALACNLLSCLAEGHTSRAQEYLAQFAAEFPQ
jgi:hypothetical protein